jgi:hypothetical protein
MVTLADVLASYSIQASTCRTTTSSIEMTESRSRHRFELSSTLHRWCDRTSWNRSLSSVLISGCSPLLIFIASSIDWPSEGARAREHSWTFSTGGQPISVPSTLTMSSGSLERLNRAGSHYSSARCPFAFPTVRWCTLTLPNHPGGCSSKSIIRRGTAADAKTTTTAGETGNTTLLAGIPSALVRSISTFTYKMSSPTVCRFTGEGG